MKTVKYHIDLDIELDPAGLNDKEIKSMFLRAIGLGMGAGYFTSGTDATVEGWSTEVRKVDGIKDTA